MPYSLEKNEQSVRPRMEKEFIEEKLNIDRIFREPTDTVSAFSFDADVALVFDDMAQRSIPLYAELQRFTARLAEVIVTPNTNVYDLGCATGTSLLCVASRVGESPTKIIGVDNSAPMLERCRARIERYGLQEKIDLVCGDVAEVPMENASLVIAHYTLQFLPPARRLSLLKKIRKALVPGGFLLLSEKATHDIAPIDSIMTGLYYDFKKRNGYSELEIAQKREALENVLIPFSLSTTEEMLLEAGFSRPELLAKCYQFCTFLAGAPSSTIR